MHILPSSWSQHWGSLDLQVLESHGPPHRDNSYCDGSWAFVPWHFSAEQHPLLGQPLGQTLRRTRAGFLKWMACMWRVARPHHFPPPALHAVFYCWASGNPKSCDPMATQHPLFSAPEPPASPSVVLQSVWVGSKHPRAPQTLSCPTAAAEGAGPTTALTTAALRPVRPTQWAGPGAVLLRTSRRAVVTSAPCALFWVPAKTPARPCPHRMSQ